MGARAQKEFMLRVVEKKGFQAAILRQDRPRRGLSLSKLSREGDLCLLARLPKVSLMLTAE